MSASLNEAFSLFLRASAGAGLPWGVADDVAKGALWCARQGFDGAEFLAAALSQIEARETSVAWSGPGWIDSVLVAEGGSSLALTIDCPALLIGLAGARLSGEPGAVEVCLPGRSWIVCGDGLLSAGDRLPVGPAQVSVRAMSRPSRAEPTVVPLTRLDLSVSACDTLREFARGVLVPSSDASRVRGAGAGLTDND